MIIGNTINITKFFAFSFNWKVAIVLKIKTKVAKMMAFWIVIFPLGNGLFGEFILSVFTSNISLIMFEKTVNPPTTKDVINIVLEQKSCFKMKEVIKTEIIAIITFIGLDMIKRDLTIIIEPQ